MSLRWASNSKYWLSYDQLKFLSCYDKKIFFFPILVFYQQMLGFWLSSEAIRGLYCHLRSTNFPTPSKRASESIWLLRYNKNPIVTFCWSFFASCWYPTKTVSCWYFSENLGTCFSASDRRISFLFVNKIVSKQLAQPQRLEWETTDSTWQST